MKAPPQDSPPLSPVLLAGIGLGAMPPVLLQPFLDATLMMMKRRHGAMFTRLEAMAGSTFRIGPTDLPCDFLLSFTPAPNLKALTKTADVAAVTASINGPLLTLLQLLEGKLDGDALFFSRDLVVDGDTEAVVMLRNIIDGAGIDISQDLLWVAGPFAPPAELAARGAGALFSRMSRDIDVLKHAVLAPLAGQQDRQAAELRELKAKIDELQRHQAPRAAAQRRRTRQVQTP